MGILENSRELLDIIAKRKLSASVKLRGSPATKAITTQELKFELSFLPKASKHDTTRAEITNI